MVGPRRRRVGAPGSATPQPGGPDRPRAQDGGTRHSPARRLSVPLSAWHSATPRAHSAIAPKTLRPHPQPHRPTTPRALPPRPFRAHGSDVRGPASNHHHRPARLARQPPAGARLWPGVFLIASGLPGEGSLRCAPKFAAEAAGMAVRADPRGGPGGPARSRRCRGRRRLPHHRPSGSAAPGDASTVTSYRARLPPRRDPPSAEPPAARPAAATPPVATVSVVFPATPCRTRAGLP